MKHLKTIVLVAFMLLFLGVSAQNPVRWRTFVNVDQSGTGTITFRALVEPGWHLYGLELPAGGPKATTFSLKGKNIDFIGEIKASRKPIESEDPMFGLTLSWWDSKVDFIVPVKVTGENASFECGINYMACDGVTCRPPMTETITGNVKPGKK